MLPAEELKDDSRERNRICEEDIKHLGFVEKSVVHLAHGASGGGEKECMTDLKTGVQLGVVSQEVFEMAEAGNEFVLVELL